MSNLLCFKSWDVLNNQVLNGNVHVDDVLTEVGCDCYVDGVGEDEVEGESYSMWGMSKWGTSKGSKGGIPRSGIPDHNYNDDPDDEDDDDKDAA